MQFYIRNSSLLLNEQLSAHKALWFGDYVSQRIRNFNTVKHKNILEDLLPRAVKLYLNGDYIFQQDCALCYTTKIKNGLGTMMLKFYPIPRAVWISIRQKHWHKMKQNLTNNPQRNLHQLQAKLQEIWDSFAKTLSILCMQDFRQLFSEKGILRLITFFLFVF